MGRHADFPARGRLARPVLILAGVVPVLVAGGLVWWVTSAAGGGCETTRVVRVTVAPEIADVAEEVLDGADGLSEDDCTHAEVTAQEPLQTVGDIASLEASALPQVWVPDSSVWTARLGDAPLETTNSMASSPVVLATSAAAVESLGWAEEAPGWEEAFAGDQPVVVPDLATSAEGLAALSAVRTALGRGEEADNAVVQAVLAAGRGQSLSVGDALGAASDDAEDAPLVLVREQEVYAVNLDAEDSSLVAVYPSPGSPWLDYPVVRVGSAAAAEGTAVDAVVRALTSADARAAAQRAGFRGDDGAAPPEAGTDTGTQEAAPDQVQLDPESVQALVDQLSSLAMPSRILTVVDVSTSMEEPVGNGTRVSLARDAAKSALALVPADYALGLWIFANELDGAEDWSQLVPTRGLDAEVGGASQRAVLDRELDALPGRLSPGGTGLYDTALAAVRAARADYDPTAVNSVLLLTDGTNDDEDGISLDRLLDTLTAEEDEDRPVKVIGVALGPEADLAVLEQIAEATGGAAYSAADENDLQTVLFDALRQRG